MGRDSPGAALSVVQNKTLELIQSLVSKGLFELGDITGEDGRFAPSRGTLNQSIQRVRDVYVARFDDQDVWRWYCWLDLTEKGREETLSSSPVPRC